MRVTTKGQVTIPLKIRKKMGIGRNYGIDTGRSMSGFLVDSNVILDIFLDDPNWAEWKYRIYFPTVNLIIP